jgi:16S rRNA (adenine1518-N6/adenine1519-N6)-dimethyltransferase
MPGNRVPAVVTTVATGSGGLLSPADVRELAADLGLRPTKRRGQNFIVDPNTVRRLVRLAGIGGDDTVLEIGPGLGSFTLGLLGRARRVVAVEIDSVLAAALPATVAARLGPAAAARLDVVEADALRLDAGSLPGGTGAGGGAEAPPGVLAANLPYNVAVPLLLGLLERLPSLRRGLVMVQAEVADRLTAAPGSRVYGAPSVKLAWYAHARPAGDVPRQVFWPVPNVDSSLIAFDRHPADAFTPHTAADGPGTVGPDPDGGTAVRATPSAEPGPDHADHGLRIDNHAGCGKHDDAGNHGDDHEAGDHEAGNHEAGNHDGDDEAGGRVADDDHGGGTGGEVTTAPSRHRPPELRADTFAAIDAAFAQRRKTLRRALAGWAGSAAAVESLAAAAGVDPGARGETLDVDAFIRLAAARRAAG